MSPRAYSSSIRDAHVEQTRALLLETARGLLLEAGSDALTLPKLAQAAGVSAPTVYRHFPTMDDLFRAFLDWLRPRLGLDQEQVLSIPAEQFDSLPRQNYPRYEAEAAVLRPLMESREFNRVRVASVRERARSARARMRPHAPDWSDAELEARLGPVWALGSPQVWRWLRDTWGLENEEAAEAASWAMRVLLDALALGPEPKTRQGVARRPAREQKKVKAPTSKTRRQP